MHDGQEFSVIDGVILLGVGRFLGMESDWMIGAWLFCAIGLLYRWSSLIEYCSGCYLECVNFQLELFAGIWVDKYWCCCDAFLEFPDCLDAVLSLFEGDTFAEEVGNGGCDGGKSRDEHVVVSLHAYETTCSFEGFDILWPFCDADNLCRLMVAPFLLMHTPRKSWVSCMKMDLLSFR